MRILATALAFGLLATPALADNLKCVLDTPKGDRLIYEFGYVTSDISAEVSMTKNGTTISSEPGKRPPWKVIQDEEFFMLQSVRDPEYAIVMGQKLTIVGQVKRSDAILVKKSAATGNVTTLAKGGCGWPVTDADRQPRKPQSPPSRKVPEWGV